MDASEGSIDNDEIGRKDTEEDRERKKESG